MRSILRNDSGNVLAITAAATIPMLGVIGGAVDISRVYLTKSRVQAACDAAVLAGRKAMTTLDYTTAAKNRATSMFNFNFQDKDYGTNTTTFASSADAKGKVSGTASTVVPMLLMKIFGTKSTAVSVKCSADIQIPNIDIVMVLDVTGSMNDCPDGSCSWGETKKIDALKAAAKDFYTTLATALAGNTTSQVRYGFVPYDEAVNGLDVFKSSPVAANGELPMTHIRDSMVVESRVANFNTPVNQWIPDPNSVPTSITQIYKSGDNDTKEPFVAVTTGTGTGISENDCSWYGANQAFNIDDGTNSGNGTNVKLYPRLSQSWPGEGVGDSVLYQPATSSGTNGWQTTEPGFNSGNYYHKLTFSFESRPTSGGTLRSCTRRVTKTKYIKRTAYKFTDWTFQPVNYNVSGYKAGSTITYLSSIDTSATVETQGSYDLVEMASMGVGTTSQTSTWNGCLEERETTAAATFTPIPTAAYDLNFIDGGNSGNTRWRPTLRDLTYDREKEGVRANVSNSDASKYGKPSQGCPTARMKSLNVMTKQQFDDYIDTLQPGGNTYLDVGLVWGLRLIAAQGMFASRNLTGPNGGQISRHIIFLTDGEAVSANNRYTAYGVERMAKRITGSTNVEQKVLHERRFQALCDAHRGAVSIWAVGLGTGVTPNLSKCADPGRSYQADNTAELKTAFKNIANEVADLRLVS